MTKAEYDILIRPTALALRELCVQHELNHVIAVELGANIPNHRGKRQIVATYGTDGVTCLDPIIDYIESGTELDTPTMCVV